MKPSASITTALSRWRHDDQVTIDNNRTEQVGHDDTVTIDNQHHLTVKRDHFVTTKGSAHHHINQDRLEQIDGDYHRTVSGDRIDDTSGSVSRDVSMNIQQKVALKFASEAGTEIHLKALISQVIESGASITLKSGESAVNINPAGVFIDGPVVLVKSGAVAVPGTGCLPDQAQSPDPAIGARPEVPVKLTPLTGQFGPGPTELTDIVKRPDEVYDIDPERIIKEPPPPPEAMDGPPFLDVDLSVQARTLVEANKTGKPVSSVCS